MLPLRPEWRLAGKRDRRLTGAQLLDAGHQLHDPGERPLTGVTSSPHRAAQAAGRALDNLKDDLHTATLGEMTGQHPRENP
jgi:hypothetical protein